MNVKNKIVTIILAYNEEKYIKTAIQSAKKISNQVYVVDSFSKDKTVKICKSLGVKIIKHKFISHSKQFNWAMKKINPTNKWVLRLDADEYLENELLIEIKKKFHNLDKNISGITFRLREKFLGKFIRFGGRENLRLLRLWKYGFGKIDERWMDESVYLYSGRIVNFNNNYVNDNSKNIDLYIGKHIKYATREAVDFIIQKYNLSNKRKKTKKIFNFSTKRRLFIKERVYNKFPYQLSTSLYFVYRYFLLLGFLDGKIGFFYHFIQGYWYRVLVGAKINELQEKIPKSKSKKLIKKKIYLLTKYKI